MTSHLPPTSQQWSHSAITIEKVREALDATEITAIEADILLGKTSDCKDQEGVEKTQGRLVPIMSHPPEYTSELSTQKFLEMTTYDPASPNRRRLRKHLKLDFKDLESVLPTLKMLQDLNAESNGKVIFLNADIIAGPGRNSDDVVVSASAFLETCLGFVVSQKEANFAFSLGFKVDVVSIFGHSHEELEAMSALVDKYNLLQKSAGIVLAINARLLSKHFLPFDNFLNRYPTAQLLVWTGSGEPPISNRKAAKIRSHFEQQGTLKRVGFDCQFCSLFMGLIYDTVMFLMGFYKFGHWALIRIASIKPKWE